MPTKTVYFTTNALPRKEKPVDLTAAEHLELQILNRAWKLLGLEGERQVQEKVAGLTAKTWSAPTLTNSRELDVARRNAMLEVARAEVARQAAAADAIEAARPSPDEEARARMLRIHHRKLQARLEAMTVADQATWIADVAICNGGLASAKIRKSQPEIAVFKDRLAELGALPPEEDDIEALLEPEITAAGIDGAAHSAEVARVKAKYGLSDDLKPKSRRK
jgi:hypothetical protein